MKKIILLLASLLIVIFVANGQERTVTKSMGSNTYYSYNGTSADTLIATNQDTIDLVVQYKGGGWIRKVAVKSKFDVVLGADTTVAVSVFGKEFSDDATYVQIIASATSDAVTADNTVQILTSDYTEVTASYVSTSDTSAVGTIKTMTHAAQTATPLDKSYRYYRIRYIISGDDTVGTGIKIDEVELLFYTE